MLGDKKKEQGNINPLYELYLKNISHYIFLSKEIMKPISYNKDNQEYDKKCYVETVEHIVTYLRNTFTSEILKSGNNLEINVDEMCEGINNSVIYSLREPKYRDIIYIIEETKYPHFHTNGSVILESEGIDCLPGLNKELCKSKINGIFEGMEITEARAMLNQMRLLPRGNNLEKEIFIHDLLVSAHKGLILSIIYNLLMSEDYDDVVRARLFAATFGVDFDFTPYDKDNKLEDKKLKKEQNSNC